MVWLIPLVHYQTVGISRTVMIAGGGDGRARDRRGPVDDWGLPAVGLDWGGCRAPGRSIVVSDAAGAVVAAAARTVTLVVVSSGRSRKLQPASEPPGNVRVASLQIRPSCTAVYGRGSCAAWHGCASTAMPRPLSPRGHD